jgi:hypothetical protein
MINNKLLVWVADFYSATECIRNCPLTFNAVKKLLIKGEIVEYNNYLKENDYSDDENSIFNYLNENGWGDSEIIEAIYDSLEEEYFISFNESYNSEDCYWSIFKINRSEDERN